MKMRNLLKIIQKNNISKFRTYVTTKQHDRQICIVGSGPAGFYAAQYISKHLPNSRIDILEKLPVPFGLVRFGVAPDHPEVKNVINTFTKTAENPKVRFLGNINLGTDISIHSLRERYHAVILAYGAEKDRKLGIPNEDQLNILSAREFVAWYNGLPGTESFRPDLSGNSVAIIGQGNVAIDVARILLSPISSLKVTDITQQSLDVLSKSQVKQVYLVGRRGPLQAAFTIKELREMTKLPEVEISWRKEDFEGVFNEIPNLPRPRKRLTELMLNNMKTTNTGSKKFLPIFLRSPKMFHNLTELQLTVNQLADSVAIPTEQSESIQADLVLRSIGYKAISVDDSLNFNDKQGVVVNEAGRVLAKNATESDSKYEKGLYVCGWLATGPTGVIITTMNNAFSLADTVCKDFESGAIDSSSSKSGLDIRDYPNVVTWDGWEKIDKVEVEAGKSIKPREKIIDIRKMLEIALN